MATTSGFRALVTRAKKTLAKVEQLTRAELPSTSTVKQSSGKECNLTIRVSYSNLNYKDALVVTGTYPGLKVPMVGGIDLVGKVVEATKLSADTAKFNVGDTVLVNGFGMGTDHSGGYAQEAKIPSEWAIPLPDEMTELDAAKIGTAGYTSMLCVGALVNSGVKPDDGPIIVTGATGGVGSIAIALLSQLGYEVVAVSGKADDPETNTYLKRLGVSSVVPRAELEAEPKPLGKELYAGCVDTVGGVVLANVLSMIKYGGKVANCGLAGGMALSTTVAPFILRGVSLLGIDSVFADHAARKQAYSTYGPVLVKSNLLNLICDDSHILELEQVPETAEKMLEGKIRGRYVVKL
ncbi:hypothetical protein ACA910_008647 [Epithemia clementina (nom. ined.)]